MTQIEAELLITIFFSQHEGKLVKDVIKDYAHEDIITKIDIRKTKNILCIRNSKNEQIIWYGSHRKSIITELIKKSYSDINLYDYINFEDLV